MADRLPGKGLFGWLGRQVGYVKKAVQIDPAALPPPSKKQHSEPQSAPTVVYREGRVEEADHPTQPGMKLRRTVIDEVIVEPDPPPSSGGQS
jgi:hypothetical protein